MQPPELDQTENLLVRAADGDTAAQEALLNLHRHRLRRMLDVQLDPRVRARVDPSDVVQETLLEAYRRLPEYLAARPLPFYPWLRQLAWKRLTRIHRDNLTAQRRSVNREEDHDWQLSDDSVQQLARLLVTSASAPLQRLLKEELTRRTRAAMDQLSANDRRVLVLRFLEQLSTAETAAVLEISETAVRMRQLRAIQRVQKLLDTSFQSGS
jgi:RNA polymerase sigma-70 factor (ECF subfamily)